MSTQDHAGVVPPPPEQQQQQQQAQQAQDVQPVPVAPAQPSQSTTIDSLTCQWAGCGERTTTPESLYVRSSMMFATACALARHATSFITGQTRLLPLQDHVCERHVGRKSTNNLNLTCQWGACRTTTVKRDHITSHIRVHVPLKPHKCDFCGKAFKRPQDLKKHVKTHADDSVLLRSPEPGMRGAQGANNQYQQGPGAKGMSSIDSHGLRSMTDALQAATYPYPGHDMNAQGYGSHHGNPMAAQNGGFYNNNNQYSGYGQVNYPQSNSLSDLQTMDTRKRAIEALNDFLGDVKRRAINPQQYYDVGQRLHSQNLPLPVSSGFGYSTGNNYSNSPYGGSNNMMDSFGGSGIGNGGGTMTQGPLSQQYSLPLSNARTKDDLVDIDRFLEQLSQTVYESSNSSAAAGIQQPGIHAQFTGAGYAGMNTSGVRSSNSPPQQLQQQNSSMGSAMGGLTSVANMAGMTSSAGAMETPALTPASVSSYASSAHSPMSSHSRSSMGSINGNSMYPSLPSVTGMSDLGAGYPSTTSAPASGLASGFDGLDGRRYSGGRLQRQAPGDRREGDVDSEAMDMDSDGNRTPRPHQQQVKKEHASSSHIDPALRSSADIQTPENSTPSHDSAEDKQQEAWVENIRVIEQLRQYIRQRIEAKEYEGEDGQMHAEEQQQQQQHHHDQEMHHHDGAVSGAEKMEEEEPHQQQHEIAYPQLKTEVA
ncbi:hypothetical protein M8818_002932 [Zalaria obscura]|uniref:Uncharacterized protein n=1 Tax=Zalaria obscura TaxID=2024903 RepID=A0ACC3SHP9_9PEZI